MVNDSGQLYSMEGVAAGLIMIVTAYFVLNTTSIYTPGDSHITDMQLEQLASDALAMMDTPDRNDGTGSVLKDYISNDNGNGFRTTFLDYCRLRAGGTDLGLDMSANVTRRNGGAVESSVFAASDFETGRESAVCVSRLVQLDGPPPQVVLVEVRIWRG